MKSLMLTIESLKLLKSIIREHHQVSSSHLSESLAFSLGFNSHASLLASLNSKDYIPTVFKLDDERFISRMSGFGIEIPNWSGFPSLPIEWISNDRLRNISISPGDNEQRSSHINNGCVLGCVNFFTNMGWHIVAGTVKGADRTYPAGFTLQNESSQKVRVFVYDIPFGSEDHTFFMQLTADFCKQDGWARGIMMYNSRPRVQNNDGTSFAMTGMLYSTIGDEWTPMFVNKSMTSIDKLFEMNEKAFKDPGNAYGSSNLIFDTDGYAAELFDRFIQR